MIAFCVRFRIRGVFQVVRRFDPQTTMGVLLSAIMLLAAVVSPGRIHAHAREQAVYDAGHPHSHGHFHDHHHASPHSAVARDGVRPATVTHIHLFVGPFEFSWPVQEEAEIVEDRLPGFRRWVSDCVLSLYCAADTAQRIERKCVHLQSGSASWSGVWCRCGNALRHPTLQFFCVMLRAESVLVCNCSKSSLFSV